MTLTMNIADVLSPENVVVDDPAASKDELLEKLAARAATLLNVPAGVIHGAIEQREALGSTGMGGGIAIPHARLPALARPFGLVLRLRKPIDFDAVDGKPVDIVFLLLLAETATPQVLAAVARKLRDRSGLAKLRAAADARELYALLASPG